MSKKKKKNENENESTEGFPLSCAIEHLHLCYWVKTICVGLLLFVCICVAVGDPVIKNRMIGIPVIDLTLPNICASSKTKPVSRLPFENGVI